MVEAAVRRSEVLAILSLAVDSGLGLPAGTGLRTCLRAVRLAGVMGLDDGTTGQIFHIALVGHAGCTADVHLHADLVGDEHEFTRAAAMASHGGPVDMMRILLATVGRGEPTWRRLLTVAGTAPRFKGVMGTTARTHCEVAQLLAARLGLAGAGEGLSRFYERWDGRGLPAGVRGDQIPLAVRVVHVAEDAELCSVFGQGHRMAEVLRERAGRAFDPEVVEAFCAGGDDLVALDVDHPGPPAEGEPGERDPLWAALQEAEPGPRPRLAGPDLDAALEALAGFADLKSFSTVGHSLGVADLAARAAEHAGMAGGDVLALRRAALVHDLGRAAVSVHVWDKPGPLTVDEWERVRLHAYHGERVLARSPALAPLGAVAFRHHERLDGSGYHRGSRAPELGPAARLLAAADAYSAMGEPRPHRPPHPPDRAADLLAAEARAGRLDADAAGCVLEAAGHRRPRAERPRGLTDREVEVLRLVARGLATKQIARRLGIAPKTADRHIQNTYAKIGVSTRAAAALFAMQHGLMPE